MRNTFRLAMILLAALSGWRFWHGTFEPSLRDVTHGFPVYYVSARLIVEGRWSERVYDDAWFDAQARAMTGGRRGEVYSANPPTTSLLALPLAAFDMPTARAAWLVIELLLLIAAVILLLAATHRLRDVAFGAGLLALVWTYAPLREDLRLAQAYTLLLFLFALAFWGEMRHRSAAGASLGAALAVKLSGAPLWLILAARRRWRTLWVAGLTAAAVTLSSIAITGGQAWPAYLSSLLDHIFGRRLPPVLTFQSTPMFFQHLLAGDPNWSIQPIVYAPWLASLLSIGVSIVALGLTLWRARAAAFESAFAAAVTLSVILLPLAEEYHYTLLLLPLAMMASRVARRPIRRVDALFFTLALILLALPFPVRLEALENGWLALLGYPRLYGGWLVWAWLMVIREGREGARIQPD